MLAAGIDEAGRGPVIGPMVVAIVAAGDQARLKALGVKDSKLLTPRRREELYRRIIAVADCVNYVVLEPEQIDRYVAAHKLNVLEAEAMAALIKVCEADVYYVDSPDPRPQRFGELLSRLAGRPVAALNRGEAVPVVAAASIVAKVVRDRLMELLKRAYGDLGSGYPSDPRTRAALRSGVPPSECVRRTWKTLGRI
ncbi:MAG: ribonuclease HII [Thermoproteus sp.]|nr:ribonuclease HII [Thermoproteus sp.]